ncbi:9540_t:CDS:2 [Funneliformis geosporum]|nr:9540_t:CDS:2 [Funneliformis geosporum]
MDMKNRLEYFEGNNFEGNEEEIMSSLNTLLLAIHIRPKPNFKDKEFIPASEIISKALKNTKDLQKDSIVAPLSGKFFETVSHDLLRKVEHLKCET